MKLARITVHIDGPQMSEDEAIRFCNAVDIDGELHDKILAIVKNHVWDHCDDDLAGLVKIIVD